MVYSIINQLSGAILRRFRRSARHGALAPLMGGIDGERRSSRHADGRCRDGLHAVDAARRRQMTKAYGGAQGGVPQEVAEFESVISGKFLRV
jgi:hypothetical protein